MRNVVVVGVLVLEQLDRDRPAQRGVGGAPHLAHAAGGDPGVEPVAVASSAQRSVGRLGHGLITASMTALAIGPPSCAAGDLAALGAGALSIITATATSGSSAGAKEMNQAYGATSSSTALRGAGLAGDVDAGDLRGGGGAVGRRCRPSGR